MLYDIFTGRQIFALPAIRQVPYDAWCAAIDAHFPGHRAVVVDEINAYLDGITTPSQYFKAGFIPDHFGAVAHVWDGTNFQPLYDVIGDTTDAGFFLGLMVEQVLIDREDEWYAKFPPKRRESDPPEATEYFRRRVPAVV